MPEEAKQAKRYMDLNKNKPLLAKPSKGKGGDGIFFVDKTSELTKEKMRTFEYIVQEYVSNPLLIENKKFDLRLYLMIKGVDTMEAYIAMEGLVRFCTEDYKSPEKKAKSKSSEDGEKEEEEVDKQSLNTTTHLMGHLTNYCLNKESDKYVNSEDFKTNDNGSKRLLTTLFKILDEQGYDVDAVKEDIKDICTKLVLALQPFLVNSFHTEMGVGEEGNQN